jgi:RNase H-like domain found in reverse transcriptase
MQILPDFNKVFEIDTDESEYRVGLAIIQDKNSIAFFSKKLTAAQCNYTVGERKMLLTVETLNEFCTMILGNKLKIYTDHRKPNQFDSSI